MFNTLLGMVVILAVLVLTVGLVAKLSLGD